MEGGREIPTADGRTVRIRVCFKGEAVQLAVVGKGGSLVEAVIFDSTQLPALIAALRDAGAKADADLFGALKGREAEVVERYEAALRRNPWLQPNREKKGLV
jgi:hypothetical protein